jgi:hypothetical protein
VHRVGYYTHRVYVCLYVCVGTCVCMCARVYVWEYVGMYALCMYVGLPEHSRMSVYVYTYVFIFLNLFHLTMLTVARP